MVLKPESITMVATDGHRLAHVERGAEKFEGVSGEIVAHMQAIIALTYAALCIAGQARRMSPPPST